MTTILLENTNLLCFVSDSSERPLQPVDRRPLEVRGCHQLHPEGGGAQVEDAGAEESLVRINLVLCFVAGLASNWVPWFKCCSCLAT